ncbi:MAG TPA: DCC1-like thiol-disulfide oxidoreductase family protein [Edaphobacter sp.]
MTDPERTQLATYPILLYDGICVLCNGVVRFLLRHDTQNLFLFVPLESPLATELLAPFGPQPTQEGVALIIDTLTPTARLYHRSDAVSQALLLLSAPWRQLGRTLAIIPRPLRELGYSIVARLRYRIFGRYDTCPLPTPHERDRIIGIYNKKD